LNSENVGVRDEDGMTLLHWAADRGFPVIAQHILRVGPSLINIQVPRKKIKYLKKSNPVLNAVRLGFF
jgi:hypothetical protein